MTPQGAVEFVHNHVARLAYEEAGRPAILGADGTITYGMLQDRVNRFRAYLLEAGITKGDRVAFLAPPSADFLIAYLAITSTGAIFLGLNPKYTAPELDYVLRDAEPVAVFSRNEIRGRHYDTELEDLTASMDFVRNLAIYDDFAKLLPVMDGSHATAASLAYDDPCALIYTSGSTGRPKGALIPHGGLAECCLAQIEVIGLDHPVVLNNLPINHIGCIGDITAYALMAGGAIVFQERFDAEEVLDLIEEYRITWWGQVPTMFQLSLDIQDRSERDLSSVRRIWTSGAPAPVGLVRRLRAICPHIQNGYGMTETVGSITWVADGDDETISETIGKPVPPYQVRLADAEGQIAAIGEAGEVQVKGRMHMLGYWRNEAATLEAYTPDGWLRTGDLAVEREDGNFRLVGRLREAFKSGGYNVYPREVEQALEDLDGVEAAVVVPVEDTLFHEVGYAYLIPKAGIPLDIADIQVGLRSHLANYKIPKYFECLREAPLLPNGKLDRPLLKRLAVEKAAAA